MIERLQPPAAPSDAGGLDTLTQKASQSYARWSRNASSAFDLRQRAAQNLASLPHTARRFPARYLTHTLVVLSVPVAVALSSLPLRQPPQQAAVLPAAPADLRLAPAPLALTAQHTHGEIGGLVGDPPLADEDAIPVPLSLQSRREALAPLMVPATISGDQVNTRGGPGTAYDELSKITGGTAVQITGRAGDWVRAQLNENSPPFWVSAELVAIAPAAMAALSEVTNYAPPPPPKVAQVIENNLNLRDGPGTNYVGIAKMALGQDLTLLERYVNGEDDWFHVIYGPDEGWVSADFLTFQPGVAERIPIITEIPDPNPALVGTIKENETNLRGGPGSVYERLGKVNADTSLDLLARYQDWAKIQTADGTKAWVFKDLINVSDRVWRRVPVANNIPAAPSRPAARTNSRGGGGGGGAAASAPAGPLPAASGDVASFAAQFVGYPYAYGATGPYAFDCSGLTSYVYSAYGVRLPRTAAGQFSGTPGARISDIGSLAPGDLVFFAGTAGPGISHVAIYIGGGQIVHAMTPAYGVGVSSIWDGYWIRHFYGAVRPYR